MSFIEKIKNLFNLKKIDQNVVDAQNDEEDLENLKEKYKNFVRNCIDVKVGDTTDERDFTRFGGKPTVPKDFKWPYFETDSFDDPSSGIKPRPLAFLAQFDCSGFAQHDKDNLLPHEGILSFFYSIESNRWGFDPADEGCSKVFWFKNVDELVVADYPEDLGEDYRFPALAFNLACGESYPDWEDMPEDYYDGDEYCDFLDALRVEDEPIIKLLGWADLIQSEMASECELVTQGYYCGGSVEIPKEAIDEAERTARDKWQLLFQMDTIEKDDFELMFCDGGRLYFWIRKEDLAARRFDRVWLILQSG